MAQSTDVADAAALPPKEPATAAEQDAASDDGGESAADDVPAEQGPEDGDAPQSRKKALKRARAEQKRAEWKEKQRAKRKRQRTAGTGGGSTSATHHGGGWRWRQFDAAAKKEEGEGGEGDAAPQDTSAVASSSAAEPAAQSHPPGDAVDKEAKREARAAKKAAELADFKARCAAGSTVIIDLEWEDSMSEKELKSLVQQLLFCYSGNRGASHPVRLVFSGVKADSFTGQKLKKMSGFDTWPLEILEGPYIDSFPKERLVYLTADAEDVLTSFDKEKVYIIGGIVDHNRLKGVTMEKAEEQGIATAQLPISQHIDMGAYSRVLTVNHVLQIVLEHQATNNWRHVFEKCIPGRKKFIDAEESGGPDGDEGAKMPSQPAESADAKVKEKPPVDAEEMQVEEVPEA